MYTLNVLIYTLKYFLQNECFHKVIYQKRYKNKALKKHPTTLNTILHKQV